MDLIRHRVIIESHAEHLFACLKAGTVSTNVHLRKLLHWLDGIIRDYGLYIYLVMVWLSPSVIVWVLRGGFWRRPPRQRRGKVPPVISQEATPPEVPPFASKEGSRPCSDNEIFFAN